jgi:transcriptional regulator with GAF, ATPase, and Fis domain
MSSIEAIRILQRRSGTMYDPEVVARFLEIHAERTLDPEPAPPPDALVAITEAIQSASARGQSHAEPSSDRLALATFYDLGTAIASAGDVSLIAARLQLAVVQLMPAASCAIYLYDADADALVARYVAGEHAGVIHGLTIRRGDRLTGWVAAQRSTIINSDAELDLGNLTMGLVPPPHACLSTFLCSDDQLVGAVTIYSTSAEPFTDRHAAILEVLAPRIASAVQRHKTFMP